MAARGFLDGRTGCVYSCPPRGQRLFRPRAFCGMAPLGDALRPRPDLHRSILLADLRQPGAASFSRWRNRMAPAHRADHPGFARGAANRSLLGLECGQALVRVGVALRRCNGRCVRLGGTLRDLAAYLAACGSHVHSPLLHAAPPRHGAVRLASAGSAGNRRGDHSHVRASPCRELAPGSRVARHSRIRAAARFKASPVAAARDAPLGEPPCRISAGLRAARLLLAGGDLCPARSEPLLASLGALARVDWAGKRSDYLRQSVWIPPSCPYLRIPWKPLPHGSHSGIPIPELPWNSGTLLCGSGIARPAWTDACANKARTGKCAPSAVWRLHRPLCLAKLTCLLNPDRPRDRPHLEPSPQRRLARPSYFALAAWSLGSPGSVADAHARDRLAPARRDLDRGGAADRVLDDRPRRRSRQCHAHARRLRKHAFPGASRGLSQGQ